MVQVARVHNKLAMYSRRDNTIEILVLQRSVGGWMDEDFLKSSSCEFIV